VLVLILVLVSIRSDDRESVGDVDDAIYSFSNAYQALMEAGAGGESASIMLVTMFA
jgi:hypothetical protein